jgi:D-beta-D-heptose 7-phosphate kinase/D-beta-D-heptose 1-phosphate adenosyltransferase
MNIIVIGDVMIDVNYSSEIKRLAPEADIPIHNILDVNYILGGSSNVAKNLNNLETNVEIVSVIGDDVYGNKIKELFDFYQIKHKLFIDKERKTTQKNRIFVNDKLNVRYDIESTNNISSDIEEEIIKYIVNKNNIEVNNNIDAIIISDYDKGVITETLSQKIITYANENNIPTFVDPKLKNYMKYKGCFLFKPNQNEAETISGEKNIDKILQFIKDKIECNNILLTRGKEGMILNNIYNKIQHESIISLVDVTGAGDVVLCVLVYVFLKEKNLLKACKKANYVGGKSVGVIGNYNVSINDIDEYYKINIYSKNNKIIYDYEEERIIEISKKKNIVFTNGCFDILHSAHIELLKFSKNQGDILIVGLNSDDSIKRLKGENRPINDIFERSKILSLFDFIDYIIIFSDDTPLNIIKLLNPDVLVKGSDYNKDNIIGREYVKNIILFDFILNKSSTNVINKIKNTIG